LTSPKELRASDGHTISKDQVQRAMYVPGDGRVTRASVLGENLPIANVKSAHQESFPVAQAFFACGGHGSLHNNRILQNNALSVLVRQVLRP